jgi:hypothetical protein
VGYADPQSVTINAVAISLPRTSSGLSSGEFTSNDGNTKEIVSHQYGKRTRRSLRFQAKKIAADPFVAGANVEYSASYTLVVDVPKAGFTVAEQKLVLDGMMSYLTASSGAKMTQLLGGES